MFVVVTRGSRTFSIVCFLQQSLSFGRNVRNDVLLTTGSISKHHCALNRQGDGVAITDLNSTNGVYLNHKKIMGTAVLYPSDVVEIGDYSLTLHAPVQDEPLPEEQVVELSAAALTPERSRALAGRWLTADQLMAARPETPQDVLETLSQRFDLEVLRGVAQNPNAPASALARLMFLYPTEVLQNAALPLLFLENPSGDWLPHEALTAMLRHELCPPGLIALYQNHQDLALKNAAAYHQQKQRERAKTHAEETKARIKAEHHAAPAKDIVTKITPNAPAHRVPVWAQLLVFYTILRLLERLLVRLL